MSHGANSIIQKKGKKKLMDNGESTDYGTKFHNRCGSLELRQIDICMTDWQLIQYTEIIAPWLSTLHCRIRFSGLLRTRVVVGGINSQFSRTHSVIFPNPLGVLQ